MKFRLIDRAAFYLLPPILLLFAGFSVIAHADELTDQPTEVLTAVTPELVQPIPVENILALNERLKKSIDYYVAPINRSYAKVEALVDLMFNIDKLGLEYKPEKTLTALETFEAGGGNCVSLSNLFIAMARYAGLDARFVSITTPPNWSLEGDVYYVTRHTNSMIKARGLAGGFEEITVDFRWLGPTSKRGKEIMDDNRAFAEYFSNVGAEALEQNNLQQALLYLEHALEIDNRFIYAWANLGVVYRRLQRDADAELAYKKALRIDSRNPTVLNNLAVLYNAQGQLQKANDLFTKIERYRRKNPYYMYYLAERAMVSGDLPTAIKLLKRAIKKNSDDDSFYFALARAYYQAGELKLAEVNLEKALQNVINPADKARYRKKIDYLQTAHKS